VIGLLIAGLLLIVAAGGSSSSANKVPGSKKLPAGITETEKAVLCTLLKAAVPLENLATLLARELFPAGSWPASDVWTDQEVAALPESVQEKYRRAQKLAELATTKQIVNECFEGLTNEVYAIGWIFKTPLGYNVAWVASKTPNIIKITDPTDFSTSIGNEPNTPTFSQGGIFHKTLDDARQDLYRGLYFWGFKGGSSGIPESAKFIRGNFFGPLPDRSQANTRTRRFSIWRVNPSTFFLFTLSEPPFGQPDFFKTTVFDSEEAALSAAQDESLYK